MGDKELEEMIECISERTLNDLLEEFQEREDASPQPMDEATLRAAQVQVMEDFYHKNHLARDVAEKKDTYQNKIQPIVDRYRTFWRRLREPAYDEEFDGQVDRVLRSMNGVGKDYVDLDPLRTSGKRDRDVGFGAALTFAGGSLGLSALLAYSLVDDTRQFYESFRLLSAGVGLSLITYGAYEMTITIGHFFKRTGALNDLRKAAPRTDRYLTDLSQNS